MTMLDSAPASTTDVTAPPSTRPHVSARQRANRRVVRRAVIALAVILASWGVFVVFEGPVASAWYTTRQHQLVAQFNSARSHTGRGAAIALLQIPRLGKTVAVAEGDSPEQLRSGPGHRTASATPGDVGNSVFVGHRSAWGGSFGALADLKPGDLVVVQTQGADGLPRNAVFKVTVARVVDAHDRTPFYGSTDRRLTLVTAAASGSKRLVVTAVSGDTRAVVRPEMPPRLATDGGGPIANDQTVLTIAALGAAALLWWRLRRRYRTTLLFLVAPIAALGVFELLLTLDAQLSPLR